MNHQTKGLPKTQVYGFVLSLVLTFAALFIALKTSISFTAIMWIIGTLAILQAGLQLFMFMHLTEGEDSPAQTINVIYGIFIAIVTIGGSIWVMSFGM
ncbi:cytochrome aa3 quinol oxidase subunit IV [Bacillus sp. BRMEA1]|uniref:cytochrome aa3 quinol oxidase subunit IV n=1 Tax=Neobacillus endophyticus TaxID=2738405 RepID=UPI00156350BF|nr:cytochrome aa3 quinol oxidase subunit IV [Neobacillus endophyticus]NRD79302.1 cytochrome aa3 quinol oxidase subunit IV [Neobacillus endophyticus]